MSEGINPCRMQEAGLDDNDWEFDTVRGRSDESSTPSLESTGTNIQHSPATIRPLPSKLPSSLRLLFNDDVSSNTEIFRSPGLAVHAETTKLPQGFFLT